MTSRQGGTDPHHRSSKRTIKRSVYQQLPQPPTSPEDSGVAASQGKTGFSLIRSLTLRTRNQIAIVVIVFLATAALSRDGQVMSRIIEIPDETAGSFFAIVSQAVASLLGLLIAFIIFRMEALSKDRREEYQRFRTLVFELTELVKNRPRGLEAFDEGFINIINGIGTLAPQDFPLLFADRVYYWDDRLSPVMRTHAEVASSLTRSESLYFEQITQILQNIEESLNSFGIQWVAAVLDRELVKTIKSFSLVLVLSLVLSMAFGTIYKAGQFPDLNIPVVVSISTWIVLILIKIIDDIDYAFRNLGGN